MLSDLPDLVREDGVNLVKAGNEWKALCPFHKERSPSFTLFDSGDGWHFHCFGCGQDGDDVDWLVKIRKMETREALRLRNGDAGQPERRRPGDQPSNPRSTSTTRSESPQYEWLDAPPERYEARYVYRNARGKVQFVVQRYAIEGRKVFGQYTRARQEPGAPVRWIKGLPIPSDRPLYRLPELIAADPARQVMVVEGEKCADAVAAAFPKTVATCWVGGTNAWRKTDWSPLHGRSLLLVADGDVQGHKAMFEIAGEMHAHCPAIVMVLPPPAAKGTKALDIADEIGARPKSVGKWLRRHAQPFDPEDVPRFMRNDQNEWVYDLDPDREPVAETENPAPDPPDRSRELGIAHRQLADNLHFRIAGLRDDKVTVLRADGVELQLDRRELSTLAGLYRLHARPTFWQDILASSPLTPPRARKIAAEMFKLAESRSRASPR